MCVNLNWLSFFTAITVATAAFHSSGVYCITNTKGHTTFHSAINGLSCYVTNQTTAGYLLNRLWLVTEIPRAFPSQYTFQNLAHEAFVYTDGRNAGDLISLRGGSGGNGYTITKINGSYSIRIFTYNQPGLAWTAQPPVTHGFVKLTEADDENAAQQWQFEPAICDALSDP